MFEYSLSWVAFFVFDECLVFDRVFLRHRFQVSGWRVFVFVVLLRVLLLMEKLFRSFPFEFANVAGLLRKLCFLHLPLSFLCFLLAARLLCFSLSSLFLWLQRILHLLVLLILLHYHDRMSFKTLVELHLICRDSSLWPLIFVSHFLDFIAIVIVLIRLVAIFALGRCSR